MFTKPQVVQWVWGRVEWEIRLLRCIVQDRAEIFGHSPVGNSFDECWTEEEHAQSYRVICPLVLSHCPQCKPPLESQSCFHWLTSRCSLTPDLSLSPFQFLASPWVLWVSQHFWLPGLVTLTFSRPLQPPTTRASSWTISTLRNSNPSCSLPLSLTEQSEGSGHIIHLLKSVPW